MHPQRLDPRPHHVARLGLGAITLLAACSSGEPVPVGVGEPTDVQLAARYTVDVEVLPPGDGCVIGGLTATGVDAEARVDQRGRAVTWVQVADDTDGADWRLAGHICETASGSVLRLRGGRTAAVTAGDDYCLVDLSLPAYHSNRARADDRCGDADDAVVELTLDACGRLTAEFSLGIRFIGDTCSALPPCAIEMRWIARPVGSGADAGVGCGGGDGGAGDGGARDGGARDGGAGDGGGADSGNEADAGSEADGGMPTDAERAAGDAGAGGAADGDAVDSGG